MLLGESVFSNFSAGAAASMAPSASAPTPDFSMDTAPKHDDELLLDELIGPDSVQVHTSTLDSVFDTATALDSPMFEQTDMPSWEPLFPDSVEAPASSKSTEEAEADVELLELLGQKTTTATPGTSTSSIASTPALEPAQLFEPSSKKRSHSTPETRESSTKKPKIDKLGCITYTRKQRAAPLTPVVPQGSDTASIKRARNTEAARRSRARKMQRMTQLEGKCEDLVKQNEQLKAQVEALKRQLAERM